MRKATPFVLVAGGAMLLASCGGLGSVLNRERPDEFAVQRQAPLVVPPDFELVPPAPGAPRPTEGTAAQQALEALFGGPAPRSDSERSMLNAAGSDRVAMGARSVAGDPLTVVVDKGAVTQAIVAAPEGPGRDAVASTPR